MSKNNAIILNEMKCNEESQLMTNKYIFIDEITCSPFEHVHEIL